MLSLLVGGFGVSARRPRRGMAPDGWPSAGLFASRASSITTPVPGDALARCAVMSDSPSITCILPVFNGEKYLGEALQSLFAQTLQPREIIVVDDGSTDSTPQILAAFGERLRVLRQENRGPAAARNAGIAAATSDLITFLDADDLLGAEKLERQTALLAARPDADGCFTHARNFWVAELRHEEAALRGHRATKAVPALLASTLLARRQLFDRVGGFEEALGFSHSTDWVLRAEYSGAVLPVLPEVLYARRIHGANRSRVFGASSRDEFFKLVKRRLDQRRGRSTP